MSSIHNIQILQMDYINMIMDELELTSPNSNLEHQPQLSTHLSGWIPVLHNALAVIGALGLLEHLRDGCFWLPGYPKRRFKKDILGLYTFVGPLGYTTLYIINMY